MSAFRIPYGAIWREVHSSHWTILELLSRHRSRFRRAFLTVPADRNLLRMFNLREAHAQGRHPAYRTLREPLPDGPAKWQFIGEENLNRMIDEYYACRGWDSAGVPTASTLQKYGLSSKE
jgi:hypothetical protein